MTASNLNTMIYIIPLAADDMSMHETYMPSSQHDESIDVCVPPHISSDEKYEKGIEALVPVTHVAWCTETNKMESNSTTFQHPCIKRFERDQTRQPNHTVIAGDACTPRCMHDYVFSQVKQIRRKHTIFLYFFERSRPPEEMVIRKFLTRVFKCLKEIGWGPPGLPVLRLISSLNLNLDRVQIKRSMCTCIFWKGFNYACVLSWLFYKA